MESVHIFICQGSIEKLEQKMRNIHIFCQSLKKILYIFFGFSMNFFLFHIDDVLSHERILKNRQKQNIDHERLIHTVKSAMHIAYVAFFS